MAQADQTWIDLDGTNDFLDFGTNNVLAGQTQFTVEMKIHFDNATGDYTLIGQRTSDVNRTIVLQRWAGAFYVFLSNYNYGYCSFIPCEATIYHVAIVFDGSGAASADRLKLYVNGVLQTLTFNGTIDTISSVTSPPANLVLGCEHNGAATQLQFVYGQFGEFCIWNYPLTSTEINNRIIPEVAGNETGLVEYFHFDNGIPGGNNTGITSFAGGKGVCTITPTNMAMNGTSSNFISQPLIAVNNNVITATITGALYQWLDCNNGFAIIPGATSQSYSPTSNGSYAVQITAGTCTDTSSCVQISSLGVNDLQTFSVNMYPNPVLNKLIIENKGAKEKLVFEILNSLGQVIFKSDLIERTIIDAAGFAPGIYIVKINKEGVFAIWKFMKD